mmetsp:Transcript_19748/g.25596  ORF Transcript_19748/g.25596 Transcript_19748/m.25596 type:complete len:508 (-) Transcript_19748:355-1878(-)|eukprot:CAMPEP_0184011132 /NCGR_PEP_ID=MMETSP0954-20121128/3645_1 /TAXON_ID=627963 /ORGANISM="Aplanochytrium sp, Strain PBS07" /LENGTH=507 /DNA_ID=CAMNT_0026290891 /DNA_START=3064 /DNA_END=4587 /DNA_ORIENTATION=-
MDSTFQFLVYNVSHIDMVLGLRVENPGREQGCDKAVSEDVFARPKFHTFNETSQRVLNLIKLSEEKDISLAVLKDTVEEIVRSKDQYYEPEPKKVRRDTKKIPAGLNTLRSTADKTISRIQDMHLHGTDKEKIELNNKGSIVIDAVYFPLIAQVVPTWLEENQHHSGVGKVQQIIYLATGSGKPRNKKLDPLCDSTTVLAQIMKIFIETVYSNVKVEVVDSGIGVFQYDLNVKFVKNVLLPKLEQYRQSIVSSVGEDWHNLFQVSIALTDGSPARMAALSASLRKYRPTYLHMWQLKTFWHRRCLLRSDLKVESFETVETRPSIAVEALDSFTKLLVSEMKLFKQSFEETVSGPNVLKSVWLRKSNKPVLSVLMVKRPDEEQPRLYRGMNVEVSLPTGSLCAERNVIGTALAADPGLRREDFRMIGIFSMTLERPGTPVSDQERKKTSKQRSLSQDSLPVGEFVALNPISPCGACNEWLKKIAEVNPSFKVVTFPNTSCSEVFVKEV